MTDAQALAEALLPCPFCGGQAKIMRRVDMTRYGTLCTKCDVWRDDRCDTADEAADLWNCRVVMNAWAEYVRSGK